MTDDIKQICQRMLELDGIRFSKVPNTALGEMASAAPALAREVQRLQAKLDRLPADWFEDSSLETWFPLTAAVHTAREQKLKELTREVQRLAQVEAECERLKEELFSLNGARNANATNIKNLYAVKEERDEARAQLAARDAELAEAKRCRIYTKCPACHNDTLTINDDKHLICTWINCPDPCAIEKGDILRTECERLKELHQFKENLTAEIARLAKENVNLRQSGIEWMQKVERLTKERDKWQALADHQAHGVDVVAKERDTAQAALKLATDALTDCHPANIWDKARMFYANTGKHGEGDEIIREWHHTRCKQVDTAIAAIAKENS